MAGLAFDEGFELVDDAIERERLGVEFLGGGGGLLGGGGRGLGGRIHVSDRGEDLRDPLALFVGRGGDFADEVRALAQRSATAAKETADKIQDSISKSEHGVSISREVDENLRQIATSAHRVDDLVGEIAAASNEQSQGITQVLTAITHMDSATQTTAATAEESAAAAQELNAQAFALDRVVDQLESLVKGQTRHAAAASGSAASAPATQPEAERRADRASPAQR